MAKKQNGANGLLKVERGIAIPPRSGGPGVGNFRGVSGSLRMLKPTESVLVTDKKIGIVSRLAGAVGKATGYKFTCRTVDDGVRVWRLS